MSTFDLPPVEPQGTRTQSEYITYLANVVAILQDELQNLLEGRIDSKNVREIAGYNVSDTELKHKSGIVGMNGADPNNPDAVRYWAGDANPEIAPFRVLQKGQAFLTGAVIQTKDGTYPRIEMNPSGDYITFYTDADTYMQIYAVDSAFGAPVIYFKSGTDEGFLHFGVDIFTGQNRLQIQSDNGINLSTPGDIDIFLDAGKKMSFPGWDKVYNRSAGQSLQTALNNKANTFTGYTGSFVSGTKTITVSNGIITSVV